MAFPKKHILLRGDTAARWTALNPVLSKNEIAIETDTKKLKVGDGITDWNTLVYWFDENGTFPLYFANGTNENMPDATVYDGKIVFAIDDEGDGVFHTYLADDDSWTIYPAE